MKLEQIIFDIFQEKPLNISYIETGLTNDNYIVTLKSQKVVLRIPRKENEGLFDYKLEHQVLKLVHNLNLDTPLLYYNKNNGVKCNLYIENTETFKVEYIERAALLIKKLHDAKLKVNRVFDIKENFYKYKNRIQNPLFNTEFAHHYIDEIKLDTVCLCHNDLVQGNLLFSKKGDYLIDYEYAADNDPFFDIMSFITENDIQDASLREKFYLTYFGRLPSLKEKEKLLFYERVHHLLWCEWAMMMFESTEKLIYKEIASLKYKRLLEVI